MRRCPSGAKRERESAFEMSAFKYSMTKRKSIGDRGSPCRSL
uniref:Uncharacterized protein n=1 Tax=Arundo donax TaxID=35708 RepID=A0A0A8XRR1_ARUDO